MELPQFLPMILVNPRLGFLHKTSQNIEYIESSASGFIKPITSFNFGMDIFLYKRPKTFIFKYDYLIRNKYDLQELSLKYDIKQYSEHIFSFGIRF